MVGRKRMPGIDQFDKPCSIDMGIDLRGRDIGMAQQRLEHAQIRATSKQMGREGMAEDVGAHPVRGYPGKGRHSPHKLERRTRLKCDLPLGNSHGLPPKA